MNRQFSGYEVRLGRKDISIFADARDFARVLELTKRFSQCDSFTAAETESASDINFVKRPVIFSRQERQNLFSNLTSVYIHLSEIIWSGLSIIRDINRRSNTVECD